MELMFPQVARFEDIALFLMRIMVAAIFATSGWEHLRDPETRSKSIGISKGFTIFLGALELACALGLLFGILTQLAAAGLILVMLGAIQRKIFVWKTGFWGKHGTDGWHYDLIQVVMNLMILVTNGGKYVLWK
jgi:putative oxidoreductase